MATQVRKTRQKEAIRNAFMEANRPLSPEETLRSAQRIVTGLSIATVYRNIAALLQDQWLHPVEIPGESARYELAGKEHHHHFHCGHCGKVFEMEGCDLAPKPAVPQGFHVTGHEFFLFGTCAECA